MPSVRSRAISAKCGLLIFLVCGDRFCMARVNHSLIDMFEHINFHMSGHIGVSVSPSNHSNEVVMTSRTIPQASTVVDSILFRDAFGTAKMRALFSDHALIAALYRRRNRAGEGRGALSA